MLAALLRLASWAQTGVGIITSIAGTGERGFSGDGGPATSAMLALANVQNDCDPARYQQLTHLTVDSSGNVYFADSNNQRIRKITPQGIISTVAGSGNRTPTDSRCQPTANPGDGGAALSASFFTPSDVLIDSSGNLIIADEQDNRIRQVNSAGTINTIVGTGVHNFYSPGAPALSSPLDWPSAMTFGPDGSLYFVEQHSNRVAKISSDGKIVTVAGNGFPGFGGDNGPAVNAQLQEPSGLAFDKAGNLYIADQANHRIRRVTPGGTISTIAGTGAPSFSGDNGPAAAAALNQPMDVAVDGAGNLYIADGANHRVRRIDPSGTITTVAGNGEPGRGPDNVAATSSNLNFPAGVAVDPAGNLYIVDWQNYLIRKVTFTALPNISQGGVVNGASFAPAPIPVAPGSIISIFGVNLASSIASAESVPLPTQLGGTTVKINGNAVPLFYVSPTQVNAQLPFDVQPGTAMATVTTAAGESPPLSFNVVAAAVGIFQHLPSSRAAALNQDYSANGPDNPEARGNVIIVFATGQGTVDPSVPTGQAASSDPLSYAKLSYSANIGGLDAPVQFFGLAPGFVGLAQANIQIPAGVTPGDSVVMYLNVNGQIGNTATISVK